MPRIKNIVGSILREFTQAQHQANMYAAQLGKEYAENDMLRYFMIPNAAADELDFELKFAVQPSEAPEQTSEVNYPKLVQFFNQLAVSIAETVITTAIYTGENFAGKDTTGYRRLKEKEQQLKGSFRDFLSKKLKVALLKKGTNELDEEGYLYFPAIFEIAMEVIESNFFSHRELKISSNLIREFADKVRQACSTYVETLVEHNCKDVCFKEEYEEEVLDIVLDSESLSEISPEKIHKLNFRVNLRNYQISTTENDGEITDCIIPAIL